MQAPQKIDSHALRAAFSRAAPRYDDYASLQQSVLSRCIAQAYSLLPAGSLVLDAGCGTGMGKALAERAGCRWRWLGVDIAEGMCGVARTRHDMMAAAGDIQALPLPDACADAVFCSLALQWVNHMPMALGELARVIKPGGKAIFAVFGEQTLQELKASFAMLDDRPHVHDFMPAEKMDASMAEAGLRVLSREEDRHIAWHTDMMALLRALHALGAGNKHPGRRKGLTGKAYFTHAEAVYTRRFGREGQIPATWQVTYFVAEKRG